MADLMLEIKLLSDTTFGRGDGSAGVVDQEVEHDPETGLPFIKGRTLKGLLVEECANILFALEAAQSPAVERMEAAAARLFGVPGSALDGQSIMHIGAAMLPDELSKRVRYEIAQGSLTSRDVLEALTAIRRQTAADPQRDTPKDNSLRAMRVILRDTKFTAPVVLSEQLTHDDEALLVACISSLRRVGHSRHRGRGHIQVRIEGLNASALHLFAETVRGNV